MDGDVNGIMAPETSPHGGSGRPSMGSPLVIHHQSKNRYQKEIDLMQLRGVYDMVIRMCESSHISIEEFLGPSQSQHLCKKRPAIWVAIRDRRFSYPEVGEMVNRDHSGVLKAVRSLCLRRNGSRK